MSDVEKIYCWGGEKDNLAAAILANSILGM